MPEERVQRRLAAILAADVVGYSRMMGLDEAGTLSRLKALRREVFDPKTKQHGGRVFKVTGDGAFVEFHSAVDALSSATDIQQALAARNAGLAEDERIALRIGISLGDVIVEGSDLYGDGVNVASRMEGLAEPGGICVSGNVHEHVARSLDVKFEDLGERTVKNIDRPIRCFRIRHSAGDEIKDAQSIDVPERPAVAVLPFQNMSGNPEQEYFADGLTEDIITALSMWRSFPVVARNSTFAYKGASPDIRKVGRELGARYVVEGSVRKAGDRIRVTAQLINAESGHHIWAERYDRDLEDIFALQDEITQRIATTVMPELEKIETRRSETKQPRSLDAWDCYLRGLAFLYGSTRDGNVRARELFERSLELDPSYGPAYTGIAYILNRDLLLSIAEDFDDTAAGCLEAAERAVALDEASSIARTALVRALCWVGQYDEAIEEAVKATELNPFDATARNWVAFAQLAAGRTQEGISGMEAALEAAPSDPRRFLYETVLALALLTAGQLEKALARAQSAARVVEHTRSDFMESHLALAAILAHLGKTQEARAVLDRMAVSDLRSVEGRSYWRRYKTPETRDLVLDGLRKAGLPER